MSSIKMTKEDVKILRQLAEESDSGKIIEYFESYKEEQKRTESFRFWLPTIISAIALLVAILK